MKASLQEATCSPEVSLIFSKAARHYIPESANLHNHSRENLKYYSFVVTLMLVHTVPPRSSVYPTAFPLSFTGYSFVRIYFTPKKVCAKHRSSSMKLIYVVIILCLQ
jgi:hypothetical protein